MNTEAESRFIPRLTNKDPAEIGSVEFMNRFVEKTALKKKNGTF